MEKLNPENFCLKRDDLYGTARIFFKITDKLIKLHFNQFLIKYNNKEEFVN